MFLGKMLILVTCLSFVSLSPALHEDDTKTSLVLAVRDRFKCNCVFIVASDESVGSAVMLQRRLQAVSSLVTSASSLLEALQGHRSCQPLILLTGDRAQIIQMQGRFSGLTWLIIASNQISVDDIFSDVNIPFNSEVLLAETCADRNYVTLTEVYRNSARLPLQKLHLGSWSLETGLRVPEGGLYSRRNNLHGLQLKVATVNAVPYLIFNKETGRMEGYYGNILMHLEARLNFTSKIEFSETYDPGRRLSDGSWDGMIGRVFRREVDLSVAPLINTPERAPIFQLAGQHLSTFYKIYVRLPDGEEVSWPSILSPFRTTLWLLVLLTASIAVVLLALLYHHDRRLHDTAIRLNDVVILVLGAMFCAQGHEHQPRLLSCRIGLIVVLLCGVVLLSSYSAILTSYITIFIPRLQFTTLEGMLEDGTHILGTQQNLVPIDIIMNAKEGFMKEVQDKLVSPGLRRAPNTHLQGMQRVCDEKYAFVSPEEYAPHLERLISCKVYPFPRHFVKFVASFATLPKDSPYASVLTYNIHKMIEVGALDRLHTQYIKTESHSREEVELQGTSFHQALPILTFVPVGIILAALMLVLEHLTFRVSRRRVATFQHRQLEEITGYIEDFIH